MGQRRYSSKKFVEPVPSPGSDRKNRTGIGIRRDALQWTALRDEFLKRNLEMVGDERKFTLKQLAGQAGVGYTRVKRVAAAQGWMDILAAMLEARDSGYERREQARQALLRDQLAVDEVHTEVNVRRRAANRGRRAQAKAFRRLSRLKPEDLSIQEALDLLKFAVDLEIKAVGIRPGMSLHDVLREQREVDERIGQAELVTLGGKLLEYLRRHDPPSCDAPDGGADEPPAQK